MPATLTGPPAPVPATPTGTGPVITAWSAVSPYGLERDQFTDGILGGAPTAVTVEPGERPLPAPEACLVPGFDLRADLGTKGTAKMDRLTGLTLATLRRLLYDAEGTRVVETDDTTGLVLGTSFGSKDTIVDGMRQSLTNARPFFVDAGKIPVGVLNHAAGASAIWHGLKGPNTTLGGGRVSGLFALNYARKLLVRGRASRYLFGSGEEFGTSHAWLEHSANAGTPAAADPRPLGEGCGLFVLEHAATATRAPLATVLGVAAGVDVDGDPHAAVTRCVRRALRGAGVTPEEVWAACPSGGPTVEGQGELAALADLLPDGALDRVPSLAPMGETASAAASLQLAAVLAVAGREPRAAGRTALVTAVDRDASVACAVLRLAGGEEA